MKKSKHIWNWIGVLTAGFVLAIAWNQYWVVVAQQHGLSTVFTTRRVVSKAEGQALAAKCLAKGTFDSHGSAGLILRSGEQVAVQGTGVGELDTALRQAGCAGGSGFSED